MTPHPRTAAVAVAVLCAALLVAAGPAAGAPPPARAAIRAAAVNYEAESATIFHGTVDSDHAGFTGTGFVNSANEIGSYVEWSVNAAAAAPVTLAFRYANGSGANRPGAITVNGAAAGAPGFAATGDWTTWRTATVSTTLAAGTNTIRLTSTGANGLANLDSLTVDDGTATGTDWSVEMVRSTMARFTPSSIGGWSYPVGLYLLGQYAVYKRTGNPAYLTFVKSWVDRFVDSSGNIGQSFNNLDSMLAGRLLLVMYAETGQAKYRTAATKIRNRFNTYPRTTDGGFWHATSDSRAWQLWSDGVFMAMPFLAEYGKVIGDSTYSWDEATKQLVVYASHLQQPNGLMKHAYDEKRAQSWADPSTGLAPEYWCRAIGWFGMATVQILDIIPADHPRRAALIGIVQNLVRGFATYQDPATGRWFQVVDKGNRTDDWTETSCSSMYTYTIDVAVQRGYVGAGYQVNADRGYQGVLNRISLGSDGRTNLTDISIGTNVGDYAYYVGRTRATNDFHGLGAFMIMSEQMR
jgi:unsaturated rhamnogalacturonyl hydrolase